MLVDLTAHHPLAPGLDRAPALCSKALAQAEQVKLDKYQVNCAAEGYSFEPLAFHCWSGLGPISSSLVNRLITQIAGDAQGWRKTAVSLAIRHAISAALMKFVAGQLAVHGDVIPRWTLPAATLEDLLASAAGGDSLMTEDLPPDPFHFRPPPVRELTLLPPADAEDAGGEGTRAGGALNPSPRSVGNLLPAALRDLNPEYTAENTRAGVRIRVRPAFERIASRTRSHSSAC